MQDIDKEQTKHKNVGAVVGDFEYLTEKRCRLIEKAAQISGFLYVFITENKKEKFADEFNSLSEQCRKYSKVRVMPSACFTISDEKPAHNFSPAADARFFGREIASRLNIEKRYVYEELRDTFEGRRNEGLRDVLWDYGIALVEISR